MSYFPRRPIYGEPRAKKKRFYDILVWHSYVWTCKNDSLKNAVFEFSDILQT